MKLYRLFLLSVSIALFLNIPGFAQQNGSLSGQVVDSLGAIVVGASVTVVSTTGTEKITTTNAQGEFTMTGLAPGKYTVKVIAPKFALYENTEVEIEAGKRLELIATLTVEAVQEEVEVSSDEGVSTDPASNAGATILKEKELEALPDDPDELEAALQALAGPAAGPGGGQIYIDGFTGGRMPPKEAIREIRINQNPFSAEYDRLGFGRIEILTRPGSDKFRGSAFGNFNDESLNSRNPFSTNRASSQLRAFGGNISGPIQKGKSSFFLDISNRDVDNNSVVNALILDPSLNAVPFQEEFRLPTRRFSFSPRFDYAINDMNNLIVRYSFDRTTQQNQGIGGFSLPTRAYETSNSGHEIRLTETMIINAKTVNETRFEYEWEDRDQTGDNSIPTISVADAFTGGGSQIGLSFNKQKSWDLQNFTTTSFGKNSQHGFKFGARVRSIKITDRSESNYGGSFSFINLNNYRDTILGTANPVQFRVTTGTPEQEVSRTDYSFFVTDDWRVNQALTLSFGLRYENQTNISDNSDLAPRFSFAWAPGAGGARAPKTVFRGGVGVFYERFSENLTLQALRLNGISQLDLIVSANDPDPIRRAAAIQLLQQPVFTVSGVTNVPTAAQILAALPQSNTTRQISDEIKSPMMVQAAFGVERQLPFATTMGLFFVTSRTTNVLRSRNINAPICPEQVNCLNAPRPDPTLGNIYEYESTGVLDQRRLNINFRNMYNRNFTLFGNYSLGFSEGDSDGSGSFPAYSYDLDGEFGRTSFDIRHNFVIGGNFTLPWGFTVAPFINANSGRPFNITKGVDLNGDALFTERPTFGELATRCSQLNLTASFCDVAGEDPNAIIPRNYGNGPKSFTVNLRFGKNFGFGASPERVAADNRGQGAGGQRGGGGGGGHRGGGGFGGGPGGRMMMGGPGGGGARKPYNLNLSLNVNNLFNNVNLGTPVGNMASSRFGQSTSTGGGFGGFGGGGGGAANRRVELQARFSW
ncbi:MAG: TonB-dependent receptor [Chloracidobacterium sp.]|nr:TonB-dependent receptor [Chloracidobacterium sp.]